MALRDNFGNYVCDIAPPAIDPLPASPCGCIPVESVVSQRCVRAVISGTGGFGGSTTATTLASMAVGAGIAVAVGAAGQIVASADNATWTSETSGSVANLWAVAYGNGHWVAAGDGGTVLVSSNVTAWADHTIGGGAAIYGIAFGSGLFVVADASGNIYSSPTGEVWTLRHSFAGKVFLNVGFGGGQFVAVGSAGFIATSPDGLVWAAQTSGTSEPLYDVAWTNGVYVAISGVSLKVFHSGNATAWSETTIPSGDATLYAIAAGGGLFLTITQESGEVWVSPNGTGWTRQSPDLCPAILMTKFNSGCGFNVSLPFLPGAGCVGTYIAPDDTAASFRRDAAVLGDRIVTTGDGGLIRASDNAICWTDHADSAGDAPGIAYGNGVFLVVGDPAALTSRASTSPDGLTWTLQPAFGSGWSRPSGVRFGQGVFVCSIEDQGNGVPADLGQLWASADGNAWTLQGVATSGISCLGFGGGAFIAGIRATGKVLRSVDGLVWSSPITVAGPTTSFGYVAYGNGVWVMTSDDFGPSPLAYRSTDGGLNWNPVVMPDVIAAGPEFGNGVFLVQLANKDFYTSPDGAAWTFHSTGSKTYTMVHHYKDCTFVAA